MPSNNNEKENYLGSFVTIRKENVSFIIQKLMNWDVEVGNYYICSFFENDGFILLTFDHWLLWK